MQPPLALPVETMLLRFLVGPQCMAGNARSLFHASTAQPGGLQLQLHMCAGVVDPPCNRQINDEGKQTGGAQVTFCAVWLLCRC
jgi:hypothetical protein